MQMRSATSSGCSIVSESWPTTPGMRILPAWQLDLLPEVPFVRVARVRRLHRVGLDLDVQHQVDDVLQRYVRVVRPSVGAPADVHPYPAGRQPRDGAVQRRDPELLELAVRRHVQVRVESKTVRQVRVVELQDETRLDDGFVLLAQGVCQREQKRLVTGIVLIGNPVLDGANGDRRDERLLGLDARQRRLQVVDVRLYRSLAGILQRPDTVELAPPTARRRGPLRRKVLREILALAVADRARYRPGPRLDAGQTLAQVRREARFRLLAIRDDVDAVLHLLLHHRRDSAC